MTAAFVAKSGELRDALRRHGLDLSELSAQSSPGDDQPPKRPPQHPRDRAPEEERPQNPDSRRIRWPVPA
jgi:hypothetical protein